MSGRAAVHRVARAVAFVEAGLFGPLTPEAVAAHAGGSLSELHRLFTRVYGLSIAGYVRARRLSEAARLLRDGRPVLEVALRCGYGSQAAFTRAFSRQFGVPPGVFRAGHGRLYAEVPPPTLADLDARAALPRAPELRWRHADQPLHGLTAEVDPEDAGGFLALARRLAERASPDDEAVGLASAAPRAGPFRTFLGVARPFEGAEVRAWPAGLYGCVRHHGPAAQVRDTLAYVVQRWSVLGLGRPEGAVDAEVFRLGQVGRDPIDLTFWLALGRRDGA